MKRILLVKGSGRRAVVWVPPLGRQVVLSATGTIVRLDELTWAPRAAQEYIVDNLRRQNPAAARGLKQIEIEI